MSVAAKACVIISSTMMEACRSLEMCGEQGIWSADYPSWHCSRASASRPSAPAGRTEHSRANERHAIPQAGARRCAFPRRRSAGLDAARPLPVAPPLQRNVRQRRQRPACLARRRRRGVLAASCRGVGARLGRSAGGSGRRRRQSLCGLGSSGGGSGRRRRQSLRGRWRGRGVDMLLAQQ
jgi:hypothetical protein